MRIRLKKQNREIDRKLLIITITLTLLGLVAVADASAPQALNIFSDKYYFVRQQAFSAVIGMVLLVVATFIPYKFWEKIAVPLFVISIILLIAVLIPGIGAKTLGARRWIAVGSNTFQPSELVKLSLCFYFAKLAAKEKGMLSYLVPLGIVAFLIMLEPDLGTTVIITAIGMAQIFVSGANLLYFFGALASGALVSLLLILTSDYRRDRLLTYLQTTQDPLGKAYHIRQILMALGLGGILGVGLGESRQKYLFLPEAATDSIFAIIGEEVGFIGASILIILFTAFIIRAFKVSLSAPDKFSKVLAVGITVWIGAQILLNIGSIVALVPLTGIPLPYFSYGGTALIMILFATGILLGISRYESADLPVRNSKNKKRKKVNGK